MRTLLFVLLANVAFAQQPILYYRGIVNAASFAPFGLPNASIARGSVLTVFGEHLGPTQSPALAFPLSSTLGGVSLSVTQKGSITQLFPIYVSPSQVNAIMPSTVTPGLATLRLVYQNFKSNAITIVIGSSAPGIFAVSNGGYGPGVIDNYVSAAVQPVNSLVMPVARGTIVTIWGTGLGPVTFPDNVAPTAGNVSTPVSVSIGGQTAAVQYSGRSPCCAGVDQIVVRVPDDAPLGCWVPVSVNAGGVVSNTVTMAIAAADAATCSDPGNPVSAIVRGSGPQAVVEIERVDSVDNLNTPTPILRTLDSVYSRFYTRPGSQFSFDPYLSYPPAGTCLVHQTSGDASFGNSLRGVLPDSASLSPQPMQTYNNGTQSMIYNTYHPFFFATVGGVVDSNSFAMNLLGAKGSYTIDPGGPNNMVVSFNAVPAPVWQRNGILIVPRNALLTLTFTPGDSASPTAIVIYAYAASTNSTTEVECMAAAGANTFTVSADSLANLPATYQIYDSSYASLSVGTVGFSQAVPFSNGLAANGILLNSNWLSQSVVLQ